VTLNIGPDRVAVSEDTAAYHVFKHNGQAFVFERGSVRLAAISPGEERMLRSIRGEEKAREYLAGKGPFNGSCAREAIPGDNIEILVNATQECNLACKYCFVDRGRFSYDYERLRMMSPETARKLVEKLPLALPGAQKFVIHFYGGEPMLNLPALEAAVDAALSSVHDFQFSVTTNGTISDDRAMAVLEKGRFSVILSIDGPAHIHDAMRRTASGEPTHARVREFLNKLNQRGLSVRGSSVVRHGWSLKDAEVYLRSLPVDLIKAQAVRVSKESEIALDAKERAAYLEQLGLIADDVIECVREGRIPRDDRFTPRVLQVMCGTARRSFCGAGRTVFGMSCDGTIYPCVLLTGKEELRLGHIDDNGAWARRGEEWVAGRPVRDTCKKCWALPLCGGGCPAMMSVCGDDECDITRANCEKALAIYGSVEYKPDLLTLAGYTGDDL
jgi:uncharacterized protein